MDAVSTMDASTAHELRAKLEDLPAVMRAVVDAPSNVIWIHCVPDCTESVLRKEIDVVARDSGLQPQDIVVHLLIDLAVRKRVRFAGIERIVERDNNVKIRVSLEWDNETHQGSAVGENGELIELRTAAAATLVALEEVLKEPLGIKLVGVKQVKAFDAELMVVALYRGGEAPQRLVGSVTSGPDTRRAASIAVLNALNRILGNYLQQIPD